MIDLKYKEDLYALAPWLREIIMLHLGLPASLEMHRLLPDGTEADLLITSGSKSVVVELKSESTHVFDQALDRKKWFDYVYVALDWPVHSILSYIVARPEIVENGIGLVSISDNIVVFRASKRNKKRTIAKITEYITNTIKSHAEG